jgi:hypothetical protein
VSSAITSGGGGSSSSGTPPYTITGATTTNDLLTLKTTDDNTTKDALRVLSSADAEVFTVGPTGGVLASPTVGYSFIGDTATKIVGGSGLMAFYSNGNQQLQIGNTINALVNLIAANDLAPTLGSPSGRWLNTYTANIQGSQTKTLTESSATGFVTITVASSEGAAGRIDYTILAKDATNTQLKSGQLFFSAAANSTGTVTAAAVSDVNTLNPCTSGTLTNTMDSTQAANATTIRANAASSLTQTTLEIRYRVVSLGGTFTVTPL